MSPISLRIQPQVIFDNHTQSRNREYNDEEADDPYHGTSARRGSWQGDSRSRCSYPEQRCKRNPTTGGLAGRSAPVDPIKPKRLFLRLSSCGHCTARSACSRAGRLGRGCWPRFTSWTSWPAPGAVAAGRLCSPLYAPWAFDERNDSGARLRRATSSSIRLRSARLLAQPLGSSPAWSVTGGDRLFWAERADNHASHAVAKSAATQGAITSPIISYLRM